MTAQARQGGLLVNLGTPDAPTTSALRRYLRQFLSDPDVIDIPALPRFLLVHGIIVPFRSPKSAHAYQRIWTEKGSPLRYYTESLASKVREYLSGTGIVLDWAMRYGNPSIESSLIRLRDQSVSEITVLPLYPQFAQSTVTSTLTEIKRVLKKLQYSPRLRVIPPFYRNTDYLRAKADIIRPLLHSSNGSDPKHLVFSFHGIPERHITRSSPDCSTCLRKSGCEALEHELCYRGQSYETAHGIARELKLRPSEYSVSFQSRLGRTPWIQPFTDQHLDALIQKGVRDVVVVCPSFVADCLETLEEIGLRERERFISGGGKNLELAPCLNDSPAWSRMVSQWIQNQGASDAGTSS